MKRLLAVFAGVVLGGCAATSRSNTLVVNERVRPNSVIVTHVNEVATMNGKVVPTSKTAASQKAAKVPVHLALGGRTMQFDGSGRCVSGC